MIMFILTNKKGKYIGHGETSRYGFTTDINLALCWKKEKSARNVLYNNIVPTGLVSEPFYVIEVTDRDGVTDSNCELENTIADMCNSGELKIEDLMEYINRHNSELGIKADEWENILDSVKNAIRLLAAFNKLAGELPYELSNIEQQIEDINHYIIDNKLSANQGYQAYKMMYDARNHRRKLKDAIEINQQMTKSSITSSNLNAVSKWLSECMDVRDYTPRKLPELFENKN